MERSCPVELRFGSVLDLATRPAAFRPLMPPPIPSAQLRPDPARLATARRLATGRAAQSAGERQRERCRIVLRDDDGDDTNSAQIWLECRAIKEHSFLHET